MNREDIEYQAGYDLWWKDALPLPEGSSEAYIAGYQDAQASSQDWENEQEWKNRCEL